MIRAGRRMLGALTWVKKDYPQVNAYSDVVHGQLVTVRVYKSMEYGDIPYPPFGQLNVVQQTRG